MIPSTIAAADELWLGSGVKLKTSSPSDPVFGASMAAAILDHPDLAGAVSHQIGERLGKSPADRQRLARIAHEAFAGRPIWSRRQAAICRALPFTIPRHQDFCRRC